MTKKQQLTTTITWTRYDGTAGTLPHRFKVDYDQASERTVSKMDKKLLVKRHSGKYIEEQAFFLRPKREAHKNCNPTSCFLDYFNCDSCPYAKTYFRGWHWVSSLPTGYDEYTEYDLSIGDLWAYWPEAPKGE